MNAGLWLWKTLDKIPDSLALSVSLNVFLRPVGSKIELILGWNLANTNLGDPNLLNLIVD